MYRKRPTIVVLIISLMLGLLPMRGLLADVAAGDVPSMAGKMIQMAHNDGPCCDHPSANTADHGCQQGQCHLCCLTPLASAHAEQPNPLPESHPGLYAFTTYHDNHPPVELRPPRS